MRFLSYSFIACLAFALIIVGVSRPKCRSFDVYNFQSLNGSSKDYQKKVNILRMHDVKYSQVYLDSAHGQLPTYSQVRCEVLAHQNKMELNSRVRSRILAMVNEANQPMS